MIDPVKIAQELKQFHDRLKSPVFLDLLGLMAKEKFVKYQSYQRAGFDNKQALELVIREVQK